MKNKYLQIIVLTACFFLTKGNLMAQVTDHCGTVIGENYIVFEAEATESPLGNWVLVTPDDPFYKDNNAIPPINQTYLEYRGANSYQSRGSSLVYTFVAPKTATYRMAIRLYQRLEGEEDDKCNDVYIKLEGDYTSATSDYTTQEMKQHMKFYGRGIDQWGVGYNYDKNHVLGAALYNLKEGEEYTLTMSGRSERTGIDYILFFENSLDMEVTRNKCLAEYNDAKYRPNCSSNDDSKDTSIKQYTYNNLIKIYPNPVNGNFFTIDLKSLSNSGTIETQIMDIDGKILFSDQLIGGKQYVLNTDGYYRKSIYFIIISTDEVCVTRKLIIY